jgi:hypothetical protein
MVLPAKYYRVDPHPTRIRLSKAPTVCVPGSLRQLGASSTVLAVTSARHLLRSGFTKILLDSAIGKRERPSTATASGFEPGGLAAVHDL